jgi:hypothetical protein
MGQYHDDAKCGSCGGPLDCHRDAVCEKCVPQSQFFEDAAAVQVMTGGKMKPFEPECHTEFGKWFHETMKATAEECWNAAWTARGKAVFGLLQRCRVFANTKHAGLLEKDIAALIAQIRAEG